MIGLRMAALRKAAGWSQAELAAQLKVSPSAVGMYEQGRREPALQTLAEISELFHVSIDYLVTGRPETDKDRQQFRDALYSSVSVAQAQLSSRKDRPLNRQELTVLLAALLMEP